MSIPEKVGSFLEGSLEVAVGKVSKGRLDCVGRTFQTRGANMQMLPPFLSQRLGLGW